MTDSEEQIYEKFSAIKDDLTFWGKEVDRIIMETLQDFDNEHRIKIPPKFRLKENRSFISKCLYRGKEYQNPIIDVEDKVGTRLVLLKSSDVYEAAERLLEQKSWYIKTTKNIKELIEDKPKEFDYQSVHLVAWPKEKGTYKSDPNELTCEIQLRTLLQHAFAEISHDSTYKGPYKNDKEIIRRLSKSIALMEVTDDYFVDIFKLMSDDSRKYSNFYKELTTIYKTIQPNFDDKTKDIELVDLIFKLLSLTDVPIDKVQEFTIKHKTELQRTINGSKLYILEQPVVLLIAFYLYNHQNFLRDHWPLSEDRLKSIFNEFGMSYKDY